MVNSIAVQVASGYVLRQGHPTLTGGRNSRISGELQYRNGKWIINNDSGRYTKPYNDRGLQQLQNAMKLFENHGLVVNTEFKTFKK